MSISSWTFSINLYNPAFPLPAFSLWSKFKLDINDVIVLVFAVTGWLNSLKKWGAFEFLRDYWMTGWQYYGYRVRKTSLFFKLRPSNCLIIWLSTLKFVNNPSLLYSIIPRNFKNPKFSKRVGSWHAHCTILPTCQCGANSVQIKS